MKKYYSHNEGYIFYDGKIQHIKIEEQKLNTSLGLTLICVLGGVKQTIVFNDDNLPNLCKTEEDCANNKPWEYHNISEIRITSCNNLCGESICGNKVYIPSLKGVSEIDVNDLESFHLTPVFGKLDNFGHWRVECLDYPELYTNEKLAEACREVEVVEADGSRHTRKSLKSLISLSDEQRTLVDNLEKAWKACMDANIRIFKQEWQDELFCINHAEGYEFDTSAECAPDDDWVDVRSLAHKFNAPTCEFYDDHDQGIIAYKI